MKAFQEMELPSGLISRLASRRGLKNLKRAFSYLSRVVLFFLLQRLSVVVLSRSNMHLRAMWGTGTIMAATLLTILPLLVLHIFTQRFFIKSIERTGLID